MERIALLGAGGKMGVRLSRNLKGSRFKVLTGEAIPRKAIKPREGFNMSARLRTPRHILAVAAALALSGRRSRPRARRRRRCASSPSSMPPAMETWKPVIAEFEKQHPDIKIELETVAGSGAAVYPDVLRTSMASGDPPDVFFMWGARSPSAFIAAGQVKEPGRVRGSTTGRSAFRLGGRAAHVDGKIYGVPYHARGMGFWYRKDMFDEYGLTDPTSYAELEAICAKLKENDIYCASFGGKFGWHTMRLVDYFLEDTCGPEVHDQLQRAHASLGPALRRRGLRAAEEVGRQRLARARLPQCGAERRPDADVPGRRRNGYEGAGWRACS